MTNSENKINSGNSLPQNSQKVEGEKTCLHMVLFWCSSLCIMLYAVSTFVYLFIQSPAATWSVSIIISLFSIVVFLTNSCILSKSKRQMLYIYLLMDNSLLIIILALIAWNTLNIITYEKLVAAQVFILVINSLSIFFFVGNFRLLVMYYTWNKAQVIITKIFIILSASTYIGIGCYFMITQASELTVFGSNYAARVKDFSIFFVFGLFSLFFEIYGKITNLDGTGDHKFRYSSEKKQ